MKKNVAQVVVGLPVDGPFDYSVSSDLQDKIQVGQRVKVLFNRRKKVGIVVGFKERSAFKRLNPILAILDQQPSIGPAGRELTEMFSEYYGCSLGEAMDTYLLPSLRKDRESDLHWEENSIEKKPNESKTTLLVHKNREKGWEIINSQIKEVLAAEKSVLFLVAEKSHIKDVQKNLSDFKDVLVPIQKRSINKKDKLPWQEINERDKVLVLGTRSAVFTPIINLGLIIVLDEDNDSYKEDQSPHYHACDVVFMRQSIENCDILLTSSAPRAETWKAARINEWEKIETDEKEVDIQVIDMTNYNPRRSSIISFPLQNVINKCLEKREKVLIFLNRKGFSMSTRCQRCGYIIQCEECNVNMTYMFEKKQMVCRLCNKTKEVPKKCPSCKQAYMKSSGAGPEKLESELSRIYPYAKISRYDKDSKQFPKKADLVLSTQAVLKHVDQLSFDVVAILDIDAELSHFNYRSAQKAYGLLMHLYQMSKKKFVVQSRMLDSYCLKAIRKMNMDYFYRQELKVRKDCDLPPFKQLIEVSFRGEKEEDVLSLSSTLYESMEQSKSARMELMDPYPDERPKMRGHYRYNILLKGKSLKPMHKLIKSSVKDLKRKKGIIITTNVNP